MEGQISIFDIAPDVDEQETLIRDALRRGSGWEGGRVRIWAMLESGWFPQYADRWMKDEFGIGGHSLRDGWFMDYNSSGIRISMLRGEAEISLTWKRTVEVYRSLIAAGDLLTREDERKISDIAQRFDRLPYPRPRMAYPEDAWGVNEEPKWRDEP